MDLPTQRTRPQLASLAAAPGIEQQIADLRSFFAARWAERAKQLGRDEPTDLTGACVFATAFAQRALGGGQVRGNWHHVHLRLASGQIIDLTDGAGVREQALERQTLHAAHPNFPVSPHFVGPDVDPMMHDEQFLESEDFLDTWDSVQERAAEWAGQWLALQRSVGR